MNWGIRRFYDIFKLYIDDRSKAKIHITDESSLDEMWNHISKYQIEKKYDGYGDNLESFWWEPKTLGFNYFLDSDKESDK